jgi:hypothetical protein
LETFSQLVTEAAGTSYYQIQNTPLMIKDFPRFPHRGLLVGIEAAFLFLLSRSLSFFFFSLFSCAVGR